MCGRKSKNVQYWGLFAYEIRTFVIRRCERDESKSAYIRPYFLTEDSAAN